MDLSLPVFSREKLDEKSLSSEVSLQSTRPTV